MMKKALLLILILVFSVSIVSCASLDNSESDTTETTTTETTTETTTTETTTTETTTTETTTTEATTTENTTATETTDPTERYNLGMDYVMMYNAFITTSGEEYLPYTSTIYYQNPYMTGDGILMFVSMENQLPHWIEDDVIPYIPLDADSDVRFEYHEDAELKHTGKFRIYVQDSGGRFYLASELTDSDLREVFAYGNEHFAGQTCYISYPFMLAYGDYSHLIDGIWGDRAVHDIMCVFKTSF